MCQMQYSFVMTYQQTQFTDTSAVGRENCFILLLLGKSVIQHTVISPITFQAISSTKTLAEFRAHRTVTGGNKIYQMGVKNNEICAINHCQCKNMCQYKPGRARHKLIGQCSGNPSSPSMELDSSKSQSKIVYSSLML